MSYFSQNAEMVDWHDASHQIMISLNDKLLISLSMKGKVLFIVVWPIESLSSAEFHTFLMYDHIRYSDTRVAKIYVVKLSKAKNNNSVVSLWVYNKHVHVLYIDSTEHQRNTFICVEHMTHT